MAVRKCFNAVLASSKAIVHGPAVLDRGGVASFCWGMRSSRTEEMDDNSRDGVWLRRLEPVPALSCVVSPLFERRLLVHEPSAFLMVNSV